MGKLLTAGASMMCAHAIKIAPTPAHMSTRVTVNGQGVLLAGAPFPVAGCPNMPSAATPTNIPCTTLSFVPMAKKVLVESKPPLLQDDEGLLTCMPKGDPVVVGVNVKVEAT